MYRERYIYIHISVSYIYTYIYIYDIYHICDPTRISNPEMREKDNKRNRNEENASQRKREGEIKIEGDRTRVSEK